MTPKQFQKAKSDLEKSIGPDALVTAGVNDAYWGDRPPLRCSVYPHGICKAMAFSVDADTFAELDELVRAKWAEHAVVYRQQITRKMALEIIRLTADQGHCTDAALRQVFSSAEVAMYSADAVADANEIADKGPFAIVAIGGDNGAPDKIAPAESAVVH